ncbi:MAG: PKD domain-containing protein [Acidobacteriota bacterium]|nr:PKD domain-containing protein [Acidobacteriota bacterium]
MMIPQQYSARTLAGLLLLVMLAAPGIAAQDKPKRPKLTVRSSPVMAFAPAMITLTAELKDGDNDFAEYYCATIEWDWDDGTRSESSDDCDPYEAGKSEIKRRFSIQHKYNIDGLYNVQVRLKQRDKTVATARTRITVRSGR